MDDLTPILDLVYNRYNLGKLDKINILEIGTGEGKNSTKILYNFFKKNKFNIISYEGMDKLYNIASNYWKNTNNVTIVNEYFTKKNDIFELLIPNLPSYIVDYKETSERFINKYKLLFNSNNNFFTKIDYKPNIIFIDSSRFMHLPIINLCYELTNYNSETIIIMEEDYFINNKYGELEIIDKFFNLKDVIKYPKGSWQWPFVSFIIESKK